MNEPEREPTTVPVDDNGNSLGGWTTDAAHAMGEVGVQTSEGTTIVYITTNPADAVPMGAK